VLAPPENQDAQSVITARFSLAAIAENRAQWDNAREYYQQILSDPRTPAQFKTLAQDDLESLKNLEKPAYLAPPATVPVLGPLPPVGEPAGSGPAGSAPSSGPSGLLPSATAPSFGPTAPGPAGTPSTRPSSGSLPSSSAQTPATRPTGVAASQPSPATPGK
jgi:hypothetical protein